MLAHLPELILFAAIAAITPGPNNIMIMSSGLNFGVRASMPHYVGICLGVPMMLAALGFGLGAVFEQLPWLHLALKLLGISYLIYLAYRIATSATTAAVNSRSRVLSFHEAFLFQWVNPKSVMMGSSAIAAYTSIGAPLVAQMMLVIAVFFVATICGVGTWLIFGTKLKNVLAAPRHRQMFNWSMAILLLLSMQGVIRSLLENHVF